MNQTDNAIEGVLLVDKPAGCTSHDVVAKVRRHLRIKKVGHIGAQSFGYWITDFIDRKATKPVYYQLK